MPATHTGGSGAGPIVHDHAGALGERRLDHSMPSSHLGGKCRSRSPSTKSAGGVRPDYAGAGNVSFLAEGKIRFRFPIQLPQGPYGR